MMVALVIVGVVTVLGVVVIAAVEAKRMDEDKPSILSRKPKEQDNKTQKKS